MKITVYTHLDCLGHDPGRGHPENPQRLVEVQEALDRAPFGKSLSILNAPLGTDEQVLLAHTKAHLDHVKDTLPATGRASLDLDTAMTPGSLNAAMRAIGAACQGVDDLMDEKAESVFCATRPPGHHATPNRSMGFCIFNQVAIAALYARSKHNLERIAILDFDVHHGNGTQDIVKGQKGIFYLSTHQSPLYPGTGREAENIEFNIHNVPLPAGTGHATYRNLFEKEIIPAVNQFKPQLLLVSAGFDAHEGDPLAGLALTDETYRWLGIRVRTMANEHCKGRLLSVLEGGYNLDILGHSVNAYLAGILGSH